MNVALSCGAALPAGLAPEPRRLGKLGLLRKQSTKAGKQPGGQRPGAGCTSFGSAAWHVYGCLEGCRGDKEEADVQSRNSTTARLGRLLYTFPSCWAALRNTDVPVWASPTPQIRKKQSEHNPLSPAALPGSFHSLCPSVIYFHGCQGSCGERSKLARRETLQTPETKR